MPSPTVGSCFRRNDEVGVGIPSRGTGGKRGWAPAFAGAREGGQPQGIAPTGEDIGIGESPPSQSSTIKGEEVRGEGDALTSILSQDGRGGGIRGGLFEEVF